MRSFLQFVPWSLLYSRMAIALIFFIHCITEGPRVQYQSLVLFLFCFGFIGDIFDGIIARYLNMDTTLMRRLDSLFDLFFWLTSTSLLFQGGHEIRDVLLFGVGSILVLVFIEYTVSLLRFSKAPSSHNTISKFFGLLMFTFYVLAFLGYSPIVFGIIVFSFGFLARLDSLLIYLIVTDWTHDVPSSYHALLIRNGRSFRKHKLLHSEHN